MGLNVEQSFEDGFLAIDNGVIYMPLGKLKVNI